MKRTRTETVEYFEHNGDRYRRFANGYWEFAETGESFCPPDGFEEVLWVPLLSDSLKNIEAIYQQPERCKTCKFYNENPYLHCAVHPGGPEGVCGDWEEKPIHSIRLKSPEPEWPELHEFRRRTTQNLSVTEEAKQEFYQRTCARLVIYESLIGMTECPEVGVQLNDIWYFRNGRPQAIEREGRIVYEVERPAENDHYRHLNDASRELHAVLSRPLRAPIGHDYFLDDLQPVDRINPIRQIRRIGSQEP